MSYEAVNMDKVSGLRIWRRCCQHRPKYSHFVEKPARWVSHLGVQVNEMNLTGTMRFTIAAALGE